MPDIWPPEVRSRMMARIRSRETGPELQLRAALRSAGIRYRAYPRIPGRPDIGISGTRIVVLVHGCFWHGCPRHYQAPATRASFWRDKLQDNRRRDRRANRMLRSAGFVPMTFWECEIEGSLPRVVARIRKALGAQGPLARLRQRPRRAGAERHSLSGRTQRSSLPETRSRRGTTASAQPPYQ